MTTTHDTPQTGDHQDEPEGRVVVGVDGSPTSLAALTFAATEARLRGWRLEAVCAWQNPQVYGAWAGLPDDFDPQGDMEHVLAEAVADLDPALPVTRWVLEGQPAQVLLHAAEGADLLVVGSRGRGGFSGLLLGSVSQQCVHHAPCPLVVVPTPREAGPPAASAARATGAIA